MPGEGGEDLLLHARIGARVGVGVGLTRLGVDAVAAHDLADLLAELGPAEVDRVRLTDRDLRRAFGHRALEHRADLRQRLDRVAEVRDLDRACGRTAGDLPADDLPAVRIGERSQRL